MSEDPLKNREIIFEFFPIGPYIKVTAMDVASLTEVSISGPKGTSEAMLKQNAVKRLEFVMRKKGLIA
ncbi:MAG: hypothetical protein DI626_05105 [Micavibrio aeruginosavorus]|uniref:DUF6898 domain-containing protein n=1 Tax=Micavibrio aeruginosavorus TaxID=349221 RepID=A0A2W5BV57_9BACT|nr:MAG: hypothetical protein DI626_05105 [Micavibrio aeruginosavorus]